MLILCLLSSTNIILLVRSFKLRILRTSQALPADKRLNFSFCIYQRPFSILITTLGFPSLSILNDKWYLIAGERCEAVVDVCLSKPCKNGGFCVSSVGSYQCWCPSGFRGMFTMPAVVGSIH